MNTFSAKRGFKKSVFSGRHVRRALRTFLGAFLAVVLAFGWVFSGWPQLPFVNFPPAIQEVRADSAGPNGPSTAVDNQDIAECGSVTWGSVDNVLADDGNVASVIVSKESSTHCLTITDFGFSIPTDATVDGIVVEVDRRDEGTLSAAGMRDKLVRIVKGGTISVTDRKSADQWPTDVLTVKSYGSTTDKWGETWTPADINATNFGMAIAAENFVVSGNGGSAVPAIDFVRVTVHYTPSAGTKIEQQINIIDQEFSTTNTTHSPTDNSLGLIAFDPAKHNGETVFFEAVIKCSSCSGGNAAVSAILFDVTNATTRSTVTTTSASYTRVRSASFTPAAASTEYTARVKVDATSGTAFVKAARFVIRQSDATSITDTQTQAEVGNNETTTSTSYVELADKKIYRYTSGSWTPAPTVYFEASLKAGGGAGGEQVAVITTGTSWTVPSDWNDENNSIEVIGGGGGGGEATGGGGGSGPAGGGGGGAYVKITNLALTPDSSVTIQVGSAGTGGTGNASANGTAGGDTFFNRTAGTAGTCADTVSACAKGGGGGTGGASGAGGAGGSATNSVGTTKFAGGDGAAGNSTSGQGGGAGGAAGPNGAGGTSSTSTGGTGGNGSGGTGGTSGNPGNNGNAGTDISTSPAAGSGGGGGGGNGNGATGGTGGAYGGGGGGGDNNNGDGGNGNGGVIVIKYTPAAGGDTAFAALYTTGGVEVTSSEVSTTSTDWTRVRSAAITLSDATDYLARIKASTGSTTAIANAKIVLEQTAAGGVDKLETMQQYVNTFAMESGASYVAQGFSNLFDATNFNEGTFSYFFEATLKDNGGTSNARLTPGSLGNVSGGAGYSRARSGSISPVDDTTYDTEIANADVSSSWLVIEVSALAPVRTFTQAAYRWFSNSDSSNVGSSLASQNTATTLSASGAKFRLRLLVKVDGTSLALSGQDFTLQFADKGGGTCASPGETYASVTTTTAISYFDNPAVADNAALAVNGDDPTDGAAVIVNQSYQELNDFTNSEALIDVSQDGKWDFSLYDNGAPDSTTYCFRAVKTGGTLLDTYTIYPEITTGVAIAAGGGGTGGGSGGGTPTSGGTEGGGDDGTEDGSGGGTPTGGGGEGGGDEGAAP